MFPRLMTAIGKGILNLFNIYSMTDDMSATDDRLSTDAGSWLLDKSALFVQLCML